MAETDQEDGQITVCGTRGEGEHLVNVSKDSDHAEKYMAHVMLDRVRRRLLGATDAD